MKIALSRFHFPITTLGPGNRIGIWFQGCSIRCPGCISVDTWESSNQHVLLSDLIDAISPWFSEADGVTISGGEPFDQVEPLMHLLTEIKSKAKDLDILVYSGYPFDKLKQPLNKMNGLIDVLISEPFRIDESQTLALRGSDNQLLHTLSELGAERFSKTALAAAADKKTLDIMFDEKDTVWIAGIPKRGELQSLSKLLQLQGFDSVTTEHGGGMYK
jgi:anaerobic ribonucleoside-triphosphate reductase activating protein